MKQEEQQHREHPSEEGLERNTQQINFSLSQREREGTMSEERWRAGWMEGTRIMRDGSCQ